MAGFDDLSACKIDLLAFLPRSFRIERDVHNGGKHCCRKILSILTALMTGDICGMILGEIPMLFTMNLRYRKTNGCGNSLPRNICFRPRHDAVDNFTRR